MDRETVIRVQNLKKNFGSLVAVDDLSFSIQKQEIVGILGPNGAGKTTTIRILTGLFPLDPKSMIEIFRWNMKKDPLVCKAQFGIVPEISNAFLDYTVNQNLMFSGKIYGLTKKEIRNRSDLLLKRFDLVEKEHKLTKSLSKGLKQRLNFCMALIHDPPILILDEPTSGLDPLSTKLLREQIIQLRETGKTVLLTTHDMLEAEKICDRVLIIHHGKIIEDDSPDSLRTRFGNGKKILFHPENEIPTPLQIELKTRLSKGQTLQRLKNGYYQVATEQSIIDIATIHDISQANKIIVSDLKLEEITLEDIFIQIIQKEEKFHG